MSSSAADDRLLAILRVVIWTVMVLLMIAGAIFAGLAIALPFMGPGGVEDLNLGTDPAARWALIAMLGLGIAVLVLALRFLWTLLAIIDTVGEGDPFVPANADRLERMGWLAVAGFGIAFVMGLLAFFIKARAPEAQVNVELDPGILFLILVLFVLARVFRHGAAMREDLEGTV
ncbi:DUF2975 domain-containing protein [Sphingomicrobium nitratireducens]|uniref:DUF2975 domain-containing protein n=1 Tax=Sphingomicrobium nitratireducens TaxID=2964666 RepID=UPI0022402297|nr:DUF2975 domain-containing protein [Sphingomicrobium nitratireducens]